ncbi:MAG: hypothetical protein WBC18_07935 [Ottowia sp.]|uniref:hypothetical protein n=1 Tax=Ottowia sp. TaxID=1898956 RepID=UPI003C75AF26
MRGHPLIDGLAAAQMAGESRAQHGFAEALREAENGGLNNVRGGTVTMGTTSEFRQVFLIYCLQRLADGSYVALNRRYKPVGFTSTEWVDYEDFPVRFKFKRALSAKQAAAISYKGNADTECIYLYNDGCIPTDGAANWKAYAARLDRLAGLKVEH